ncbi:MAG: thioredoxin family protein, partial [Pirellulaceae bacterium]|nr:thioredoxin family protein [Pirellulaceae bacterium]
MASLNAMLISCALSGAGDVVLLEFSSDRCQYCRQMESIVRRLVSEDYPIRKINVEHEKNLAQQFHITGVPSYVMLVDGREASRIEGAAAFGELRQMYSDVGFKPTSGG